MAIPSPLSLVHPGPGSAVQMGMASVEATSTQNECELWNQGSPYLGNSDRRSSFHGLSFEEARQQLVHYRTVAPWRRKQLFRL
jgi:hypothetical protein